MAEFHGYFPSLCAISIDDRGEGEMGGGVVGNKKSHLAHPMSSYDAHTVTNDTSGPHIVSGSKHRSPLPNWHPPWVLMFQP